MAISSLLVAAPIELPSFSFIVNRTQIAAIFGAAFLLAMASHGSYFLIVGLACELFQNTLAYET